MRIAIAYALAGIGHRKAAEALHATAQERGHDSQLVDALEHGTPTARWLYPRIYLWLITYLPMAWGLGYALSDARWLAWPLRLLRRLVNGASAGGFARWLAQTQPEVVVATHFLPAEIAASLKRSGRLRARLVVVVTDWYPHGFWVLPGVDCYAVAGEFTRRALLARGVPAERIHVTGIPIDPRFAATPAPAAARQALGLDLERPTVLVTGGGFGVGPMRQIVEALVRSETVASIRAQVAVVCGHNPVLVQALKALAPAGRVPLRVFGFVEEMPALMAASDLLIAKPGGLTVTEALAAHLPMVLYGAIPGQETHNQRCLVEAEAAVVATTPTAIREAVLYLLRTSERLVAYRQRAAALAHPVAAAHVIHRLVEAA